MGNVYIKIFNIIDFCSLIMIANIKAVCETSNMYVPYQTSQRVWHWAGGWCK